MKPIDLLFVLLIALIVGGAILYIVRAKRRGQKCIGCPDAKTCNGNCASCHACYSKEEKTNE